MSNKTHLWGRGAEVLVGLIFLVAAVLKAVNINLFIGQIFAYEIFTTPGALKLVAIGTLALETFLGLSLLVGSPWRKGVLLVTAAMLVFFSGLITYAWQVNGLEDCGCFGKVSFTPPQALAKNAVFLVLTGVAWLLLVKRAPASAGPVAKRGLRLSVPVAAALVLCAVALPQLGGGQKQNSAANTPSDPASTGVTPDGSEANGPGTADTGGIFHNYTVETDWGETLNLGEGEYLVALLSMTCDHCMESVPQLNNLSAEASLPRLVAVCLEPEEGSMADFQGMTGPQFPMASVGNDMLEWAAICEGTPPRLCYVRGGEVVEVWTDPMPDFQTVLDALGSPDNT